MSAVASSVPLPWQTSLRKVRPSWLWLSLPLTLLAVAGSLAGILIGGIYSKETANWAGQMMGLLALVELIVLYRFSRRVDDNLAAALKGNGRRDEGKP